MYLLLIWSNPQNWAALPPNERAVLERDSIAEHAALDTALLASGELVTSAALADPEHTRTVRIRAGVRGAFDGPFAEVKEHLAGFYLVDCDNLERATDIAALIPDARWERVEVRPVQDVAGLGTLREGHR